MSNKSGVCKECGVSLVYAYGDLEKSLYGNIPSLPGACAAITPAAKNAKSSIPKDCKSCAKARRKKLLKKIFSFVRS